MLRTLWWSSAGSPPDVPHPMNHDEVIEEASEMLNSEMKDRVARIAAHEAHVRLEDIEQVHVSEVTNDHVHIEMMACDLESNQCVAIEKDVDFKNPCAEGGADELECIMENIDALAKTWTEEEDEALAPTAAAQTKRAEEAIRDARLGNTIERLVEVMNTGGFHQELKEVIMYHLPPDTLSRLTGCADPLDLRMATVGGGGGGGGGGSTTAVLEDSCSVESSRNTFTDIEVTVLSVDGFRLSARAGKEVVAVDVPFSSRAEAPEDFQQRIMEEVQSAWNRNRGKR
jgi:hypothetical protein